jgi:hypothetical protein
MNVPPPGSIAGMAGAPLAQSKGSDVERAGHDVAAQQRQTQAAERAEEAAGIGATEGEDNDVDDRDADGRRLWEQQRPGHSSAGKSPPPRTNDPTGQSGTYLDLTG